MLQIQKGSLPVEIERQLDHLSHDERGKASAILNRFASLFDGSKLGQTEVVCHRIQLSDDMPVKQMPRRLSQPQREIMEREVKDMLDKGVIQPSFSPWASPIVLVKDNSTRFCIDYRELNARTIADAYPLPNPNDILDSLSGSTFFATLDLKSGFWQVPMSEQDRQKTAFCVPGGHYEFLRMPFGLINATATFQRLMERVLQGLLWNGVGVFVDDVVVYDLINF